MRFGFVSEEGLSLSWWLRLISEGHEVMVYETEQPAKTGDGLVQKAQSLGQLKAWGGKDALYVFDFNGKGAWADQMRRQGMKVFGGGEVCDKLEQNRRWGDDIAKMVGMKLPESIDFKTIDDAIGQAKKLKGDSGWYFKSDKYLDGGATFGARDSESLVRFLQHAKEKHGNNVHGIIQKKLDGIVLSTMWWWNGERMTDPLIGMLENKKTWTGDLGPNAGCAINLVWPYTKKPRIASMIHTDKIEALLKKLQLPPGEYDVNVILNKEDKQPYFLEWGPRCGWDEDVTYLAGLDADLGDILRAVTTGSRLFPVTMDDYWFGLRVSTPPYPWEHLQKGENAKSALGVPIAGMPDLIGEDFAPYGIMKEDDEYFVADPNGLVGVVLAQGTSLSQLDKDAQAVAKKIICPNLQYRIDALDYMKENMRLLKGWGYTNEMPEWSA